MFSRKEMLDFERAVDGGDFSQYLTLADQPVEPYPYPLLRGQTYCGLVLWAMKTPQGWLRGITKSPACNPA
jgi:hypothetical protein